MDDTHLAEGDGGGCHSRFNAFSSGFGEDDLHVRVVDVVIDGAGCIASSAYAGDEVIGAFASLVFKELLPYFFADAGLDYPGIGPMHANLAKQKRAIVLAVNDDEAIRAAYELTRLEGIIPALESAHALGALEKMRFKPTDVVVLTVSGRGDKDIETYLSDE